MMLQADKVQAFANYTASDIARVLDRNGYTNVDDILSIQFKGVNTFLQFIYDVEFFDYQGAGNIYVSQVCVDWNETENRVRAEITG